MLSGVGLSVLSCPTADIKITQETSSHRSTMTSAGSATRVRVCVCVSVHRRVRPPCVGEAVWAPETGDKKIRKYFIRAFAAVLASWLLIVLRVSSLIKYCSVFVRPHAYVSALLSHEVWVCYQSDFLSQILISNQSSWLNLKSEPGSINHITCLTPTMPAHISHRNETPPCVYVGITQCVCVCVLVSAMENGCWQNRDLIRGICWWTDKKESGWSKL